MNQPYRAPNRAPINLTLPWHSSSVQIADCKISTLLWASSISQRNLNPAKPWSTKDFFSSTGYYTHPFESYIPKPESEIIPSRSPPPEQSAKDQPFYVTPRNPDDPRMRSDLSAGSYSVTASQIQDHEALNWKNAAAISSAITSAEYAFIRPEISDETRAALHHLKLDLVASFNFFMESNVL